MTARLLIAALLVTIAVPALAQQPPGDDKRLATLEQTVAQLLKEVQAMRAELKQPAAKDAEPRVEVKIFTLKNGDAEKMVKTLQGLLQGKDGQQIKIVADQRTNSVLVSGRADQQEIIEAIIARLDETGGKPKAEQPAAAKSTDWAARLKSLETDFEMLLDRSEWSKRMAGKKFLSESQAKEATKHVEQARDALRKAQEEYRKYLGDDKKPAPADKPADKSKFDDAKKPAHAAKPKFDDAKKPAPGEKPKFDDAKKPSPAVKPKTSDEKKPAPADKPKIDDEKKPAPSDKPKSDEKKPASTDKPKIDEKKPAPTEKPKIDDEKKPAPTDKPKK